MWLISEWEGFGANILTAEIRSDAAPRTTATMENKRRRNMKKLFPNGFPDVRIQEMKEM